MDVPADKPIAFRSPSGVKTVTFINNDAATDVWLSDQRSELLAKFPPDAGTNIAHGGIVFQIPGFTGVKWLRANGAIVTKLVVDYLYG